MTYIPEPAMLAVEQMVRDLITENPELPIRAQFYRGRNRNMSHPLADPTLRDYAATPAAGAEWFVLLVPTVFDIIVQAAGRMFLGVNDTVGSGISVALPQTSPGVVDIEALSGSELHVELLAAIREKAAVVDQMRAAVGS